MNKITLTNDITLYEQIATVSITAPAAGIVVSNKEEFSIVPKFVPKGKSEVIVIRHYPGIIAFDAGLEVGYVAIAEPAEEEENAKDGE